MNLENLKNKKLAIVHGQSIEGCGVTRVSTEMQLWADKVDVGLTIYSYDERMYNRREAHELYFIPFLRTDIPKIVDELNQYDAVIFQSYPSAKFDNASIKAFYQDLVKKVTAIKVGFMHELNKTNTDKIPFLIPIMNEMDLIYNFSEQTWFSQEVSKALPSKELGKRVKKFTMMFNFDELDQYRQNFSLEDKEKKLSYLGRWTTGKKPRRVLDLAPMLKEKDPDFKCELKGIERSIGAKTDIFDHPNCLDLTGKNVPQNSTGFVPVYGPYNRQEGMEYMAKSLFGCSFYRLPKDPDGYGDRMEYTQIEIIGVGSVPVFDQHWGENNRTKDGRRYVDIPFSAIYSDENNLEETVRKIIEVSKDRELQQKYIDTSYQIVKNEFDVNIVMPELLNYIFEVGKDEGKFKSEEDLFRHLTSNEEFVEDAVKIMDESDDILVTGFRELAGEKMIFLSIIDGKKEKELKKWKK